MSKESIELLYANIESVRWLEEKLGMGKNSGYAWKKRGFIPARAGLRIVKVLKGRVKIEDLCPECF